MPKEMLADGTKPVDYLDGFLRLCAGLRAQTTNCPSSQKKFAEVRSVPEAAAALRMFWQSVVEQVPAEFIRILSVHYLTYKADMNAAGVYFNEPPADPTNALVFIGDSDGPVIIKEKRPRVIVLGRAFVVLGDHARCECHNAEAKIHCYDYSRASLRRGTAFAFDRSFVEGAGEICTNDCSEARITGGVLYDHGHLRITAYNNAVVHSFTHRKIVLYDDSKLIIDIDT